MFFYIGTKPHSDRFADGNQTTEYPCIRGLFPKTEPDSICYFAGFAVRSRADSFPVRSSRLLTGRTPPMDHNGKEIPPLETGRGTGGRNGTGMVQEWYRFGA